MIHRKLPKSYNLGVTASSGARRIAHYLCMPERIKLNPASKKIIIYSPYL
jgi:hypothetical protein